MKVFRGLQAAALRELAAGCALTIGNFDGVHRGHQAMIALLRGEARHRGLKTCALTFEPHPKDFFARQLRKPELAPARISTLRDKLQELENCGLDCTIVLPFNAKLANMQAQDFVEKILLAGLNTKYLLVGDDFRFGAKRAGDFAFLHQSGMRLGFDVARMNSYEIAWTHPGWRSGTGIATLPAGVFAVGHATGPFQGLRVSSSAVREALAAGRLADAAKLLGRPYSVSGHVVHGAKLGRELGKSPAREHGFATLNLRFSGHHHRWQPAASGIFAVRVHGLDAQPLAGVANFGTRPAIDPSDVNGGRVLLETHILDWPAHLPRFHGYGSVIRVEFLAKLHDELKYDSLDALTAGIEADCLAARAFFAKHAGKTAAPANALF
jgi:riboflavin kinase/FMN adenylyltransferase